ncbi:hypothetical protein AAF712_000703 [Marasmius tenuissimus]|uniref:RRM domain-containing protein n=1 Tax=Marasmius tenuissimus TaxID=585030 RepID=A0ABR3ACV0_9AGAR
MADARGVELDASVMQRKYEKMPHDASVFVGSLPPHIDNNELVRLLTEHLSEHAEVKCVKVIRDNKGGACAFVQCQDAASAARLIHTLHSNPPKPFLGRHLRYEQARAFRTLLVSYCVPIHHIMATENGTMESGIASNTIELDLPPAMRIVRSKHSRSHTINYNALALEPESKVGHTREPSIEQGLHLEPLMFDDKTLKSICAYFGPLEMFESVPTVGGVTEGVVDWTLFPAPHNAPRKPSMDKRVFEVKWEHRDDCVNSPEGSPLEGHLGSRYAVKRRRICDAPRTILATQASADVSANRKGVSHHDGSESSLYRAFTEPFPEPEWNVKSVSLPHEDSARTLVAEPGLSWSTTELLSLDDAKDLPDSDVWSGNTGLDVGQKLDSVCVMAKRLSEMKLPSAALESCAFAVADSSDRSSGGNELELPPAPALTIEGYGNVSVPKGFGDETGNFQIGVSSGERTLDTTTLFVGGLELNGPGAWDEGKVRSYFEKFEGLQNVRIIRPANGKAAFAFVKFDNTDSPARAIRQEHNRIYQGRAMRVQFREYNFSRGAFVRGRGRGHFAPIQSAASHARKMQPQHIRADVSADLTLSDMSISTADTTRAEELTPIPGESKNPLPETAAPDVLGIVSTQTSDFAEKPQGVDFPNLTRPNSRSPIEGISQPERYREWYEVNVPQQEVPSTNVTPSPTAIPGSEGATNGTQYPVPPPAGYYTAPSWMQPYPPQVQYPVPYVPGYPVYPIPNPSQPTYPSSTGSDSHVPTSTAPNHWPVYGPYIPYPSPYPPRPPHTAEQPVPPQGPSQPPVAPSGFLQGEQGTLIAVYRQDALDHYMHQSVSGNPPPSQSHIPHVWPQYPPPPYPVVASSQAPPRTAPVSGLQPPKQVLGSAGPPSVAGGARLSRAPPPVVFNNGNANITTREHDGHAGTPKRGRRDGAFHQRNAYPRQGPHRHGRGASFVHQGDFPANPANGNPGNFSNWPMGRREAIKPFHLS